MTPERWATLSKVFEQALELPESQRENFIIKVCSNDPDLEGHLRGLLSADGMASNFLEPPLTTRDGDLRLRPYGESLCVGELVSNRFEIIGPLGRGGMGQVFEAFDRELQERIAIKVLDPEFSADPASMKRFKKEIQFARRITHPNVCRTFDFEHCSRTAKDGSKTDIAFLTMELLLGETLAMYISRRRRMPLPLFVSVVEQMAAGLDAAHRADIIHRDFKPSNVIVIENSDGVRAVVTDFGIARACLPEIEAVKTAKTMIADSVANSGGVLGTLEYMAPEQLERGEATPASDVYALGLVMYELVTNRRPFQGRAPLAGIIERLKHCPESPRKYAPELDTRWETIILRCLEIRPERRFKSAGEFLSALPEYGGRYRRRSVLIFTHSALNRLKKSSPVRCAALALALLTSLMALFVVSLRLFSMYGAKPAVVRGSMLMLTEITNDSRDPELDSVTELFRSQLDQSAYMGILPTTDVQETLERMALPKNAPMTPAIAREVALRRAVPLVIFGDVSRVSDDYNLDLKLERVGSHPFYAASSWTFRRSSPDKKSFFDAIHEASVWLRTEVGESRPDINESDRRPEDVTTDNWEALKLYTDGQRMAAGDRLSDAILLYKEAAAKDPQFSMALMRAGDTLDTLGKTDEGMVFWEKALSVKGLRQLSPREELRITGMFANDVGDLKSAIDAFAQYSIAYPDDYLGYFYRAYPLMMIGRTDEAVEMLHKAEGKAKDSYYIADHLARYYLILGDFSSSERYLDIERQLGKTQNADLIEGQRRFLLGDRDGARSYFTSLLTSEDQFVQTSSYYLLASVFAEEGRYREAIVTLQQGAKIDARNGSTADQGQKLLGLAYLYLKKGDLPSSREAALTSFALEPSPRRAGDAATLLARAGFADDAEKILRALDSSASNMLVKVVRLRVQGEILFARDHKGQALSLLDAWRKLNQERALLQDSWAHATCASNLNEDCLGEYNGMLSKPGQIWHQAEVYFPGYLTDLRFQHAKTMAKLNRPEAKQGLAEYLEARRLGDSDIPEIRQARALAAELSRTTPQTVHKGDSNDRAKSQSSTPFTP